MIYVMIDEECIEKVFNILDFFFFVKKKLIKKLKFVECF